MLYYKIVYGDTVVGYKESSLPETDAHFVQITLEEYLAAGCTVEPISAQDEAIKMLNAQLDAATERQDFLEDCLAELATVAYAQ